MSECMLIRHCGFIFLITTAVEHLSLCNLAHLNFFLREVLPLALPIFFSVLLLLSDFFIYPEYSNMSI